MTPCNQHLSRRIAIAVVCAVVLPSFAVQQETLRAAASTAWNMPFGDFEGERMVGGIYFDLYKAIAQKTGLTLLPVVLPRKRVEEAVANGEIDLRGWCIGFMEGVFLREAAWFENAEEEVSELLLPIMVVSGLFDDQPEFSDIATDAKLVDDMVEQIPELLTALFLLCNAPDEKPALLKPRHH